MGIRTIRELDAAHRLETGPADGDAAQAEPLLWLTRRQAGADRLAEADRLVGADRLAEADRLVGGAQHNARQSTLPVLRLSFDLRSRSRLKARLEDGRAVGIVLPRGSVLRGGDLLLGPHLRVQVVAAEEDVLDARATDPALLVRAAYHLGNRHVPVQLGPDALRLGWDSVLAEMLTGLGLSIMRGHAPFEPEAGAYAHRA